MIELTLRHDPAGDWTSRDPVLHQGEIGLETDTGLMKLGDGSNWSALQYINDTRINAQTGTAYTVKATDRGKWITCSNASPVTVTVPSGLGAGFNCVIQQIGAGAVTISGSGATINNIDSHTGISGQYGIVTLFAYAANTFVMSGNTV